MTTREYEAMFLLDNTAATADFEGTAGQVDAILEKHGATIVHKEKWDERKLAYEIHGHRRATYYLIYFSAPTQAIREIDQDVGLNEVILRHLAFALDEPIQQHMEKQAADREKMAEESRKSALSGWGDRDRKRGGDRGPRREKDEPSTAAPAPAPAPGATPAPEAVAAAAPSSTPKPAPQAAEQTTETAEGQ